MLEVRTSMDGVGSIARFSERKKKKALAAARALARQMRERLPQARIYIWSSSLDRKNGSGFVELA